MGFVEEAMRLLGFKVVEFRSTKWPGQVFWRWLAERTSAEPYVVDLNQWNTVDDLKESVVAYDVGGAKTGLDCRALAPNLSRVCIISSPLNGPPPDCKPVHELLNKKLVAAVDEAQEHVISGGVSGKLPNTPLTPEVDNT